MTEETFMEQTKRYAGSIVDELEDDEPNLISIDFWLFKLKRRIDILRKAESKKAKEIIDARNSKKTTDSSSQETN